MELCTAAARAPEFSWVRRNFFRDRRALNFATRRGSNFFDTFHFKTSFPNLEGLGHLFMVTAASIRAA